MAFPSPYPSLIPRSRIAKVLRQISYNREPDYYYRTRGSNLKIGATLPHTVVSPVAESPAREAEASRPSPIITPSPLGVILNSLPEGTPVPVPVIPPEPPTSHLPETGLQVSEPPPNLPDSPQAQGSTLPIVELASGKLSDDAEPQPTVTETPDMAGSKIAEPHGFETGCVIFRPATPNS